MATNYSHQERNIRGVARAQREIQGEERNIRGSGVARAQREIQGEE